MYLDTCCLNRPFDDQTQERVRLEAETVLDILFRLVTGEWTWIGSDVLEFEVNAIPEIALRTRIQAWMRYVTLSVRLTETEALRAKTLLGFQIKPLDGQHIACAETGGADVFLTTNDRLLAAAQRAASMLHVRVMNPVQWLEEI